MATLNASGIYTVRSRTLERTGAPKVVDKGPGTVTVVDSGGDALSVTDSGNTYALKVASRTPQVVYAEMGETFLAHHRFASDRIGTVFVTRLPNGALMTVDLGKVGDLSTGRLSRGSVVGIVVGSLVGVALLTLGIVWVVRRMRRL